MSVESQPNNIDDLIAEFKELSAEDSDMYIAFVQLDTKEVWELKACLSIRTRTTFNILATAAAQIVDPNSEGDLVRQWFVNVFRMVPELVGSDSTDYLGNASVGDGDNEREVIFKTSTIPNAARASATALLRFKMERRTETPAEDGKAEQVIEGREKLRNWTQPDLDDSPAKLDEQEQRPNAAQSKVQADAKSTEESDEIEQVPARTKADEPTHEGAAAPPADGRLKAARSAPMSLAELGRAMNMKRRSAKATLEILGAIECGATRQQWIVDLAKAGMYASCIEKYLQQKRDEARRSATK